MESFIGGPDDVHSAAAVPGGTARQPAHWGNGVTAAGFLGWRVALRRLEEITLPFLADVYV
jgi:hypothetical protein